MPEANGSEVPPKILDAVQASADSWVAQADSSSDVVLAQDSLTERYAIRTLGSLGAAMVASGASLLLLEAGERTSSVPTLIGGATAGCVAVVSTVATCINASSWRFHHGRSGANE